MSYSAVEWHNEEFIDNDENRFEDISYLIFKNNEQFYNRCFNINTSTQNINQEKSDNKANQSKICVIL
jgi:hypothetical protein